MHSNLRITDGVYGIPSDMDSQKRIASLGNTSIPRESKKKMRNSQ
jgi:hypothetical protein